MHLHVHSSYSLLEGALTIARLAELAKKDRQPALALTDTDNMFGALEFSEKMAGAGIQPIVGCALGVDFGDQDNRGPAAGESFPRIVLLAAREEGYRSLLRLTSRAYLETAQSERPHLKLAWLAEETPGLIALSGGPGGPLDTAIAAGQGALAAARCETLHRLYGDRLYIELQRHGMAAERLCEPALIELAYARGLPLVATNEPFFAAREDYEAHDALLCIAEGRLISDGERRQLTAEHRLKTRAEMAALFADLPEALAATVEIAQRCAFRPRTRAPILPRFSAGHADGQAGQAPAQLEEAAELRRAAAAGLERRLARHPIAHGHSVEDYRERLAFELGVIEGMKYAGYFLIVADFIQWAKAQGIPVGPGRGSGAGSLVAYALTITDLDPIRFGLLFERFLNPERVSMPDFDVDFCQERRDEVIRYVQEKYGRDQVAQIITFGTLQARGVLRDVGRVLQMPYGQVDKLCKLVPQNPTNPISLKRAIDDEPRLQAARDADPVTRRAFDIAQKLEGLTRHASTHAAGIVIGDRPLSELVPLYRDPKSLMPVTQFNMKWVEPAGPGEVRLPRPQDAHRARPRGQAGRAAAGSRSICPTCRSTTRNPTRCWPAATPSACSRWKAQGMRRALVDMRPDRFEDIIALVALYRPGPMANIPTYCARKQGLEAAEYIHPKLEPILRETYGVIVYQEQVMQAAQVLSGYSLGEADLLRRAMGKKIRSEMQAQRDPLRLRRGRARRRGEPGGGDLRTAGALRRLRLQQEPRRGLCAGRLSDRLYEGELSGRVPRRLDDARHGQHRQARRIPRRGRAARHQGRGAVDQPLRRRVRRRGQHHSLCARGAARRRPPGGRRHSRRARRQAVQGPCRLRPPHQSARHQQTRAGKPRRRRRVRQPGAEPRPRARGGRHRSWPRRSARTKTPRSANRNCSAARRRPSRCGCRRSSRGCRPSGCGANTTPSAFS